jgi:hypothetical protein
LEEAPAVVREAGGLRGGRPIDAGEATFGVGSEVEDVGAGGDFLEVAGGSPGVVPRAGDGEVDEVEDGGVAAPRVELVLVEMVAVGVVGASGAA